MAKYLNWNSIRLKFVKTSMPNTVKNLGYISATDHIAPSLLKALAIILNTIVRKAVVDREDLKLYWKSEKRPTVLYMTNAPIIYKFFKDFTNHRKKSSRVVVFSCRLPKNS